MAKACNLCEPDNACVDHLHAALALLYRYKVYNQLSYRDCMGTYSQSASMNLLSHFGCPSHMKYAVTYIPGTHWLRIKSAIDSYQPVMLREHLDSHWR